MKVGGGADYAKVAERLKLFREDCPRGKQESAYEVEVDGSIVFTVWLWKDKSELIELMKAGVSDKDVLRSSSDANGTAKSKLDAVKEKDFEKLESIALGRALANLGYLASGEIASSEEMEEFEKFRIWQLEEAANDMTVKIEQTMNNLALNKLLQANSAMLKNPLVVEAAKRQQAIFAANQEGSDANN